MPPPVAAGYIPVETIKCVMCEGAMNIFKKAVQKAREKLQHRCLGEERCRDAFFGHS